MTRGVHVGGCAAAEGQAFYYTAPLTPLSGFPQMGRGALLLLLALAALLAQPRPALGDDRQPSAQPPELCASSTIAHSDRSTPATACVGSVGAECAYTCDAGFLRVGRHVCQSYRILDRHDAPSTGLVVLNRTFFGGRCDRLCTGQQCRPGEAAVRHNSSDRDGPCLATVCEPSAGAALRRLARGNYEVWRRARNPATGVYAGSVNLEAPASERQAPAISDVTGIGLTMETIALSMGWINRTEAQRRVEQTLAALAGDLPGFAIPRNKDGFLPTFFDQNTGKISMMGADTFALMSSGLNAVGVLFAARFFERTDPGSAATARISALARRLVVDMVHWDTLLCGPGEGGMVETCTDPTCGVVGGTNATGIPTLVNRNGSRCNRLPNWNEAPMPDGFYQYNEEHYTVWLAFAQACSGFATGKCPNQRIERMWEAWRGRRLHPTISFGGHPLLSLWSSYIVQLPYYTMHEFSSDPAYEALFKSHWLADWAFYNSSNVLAGERGRYGLGAGPLPSWCSPSCKPGQPNCYLADFIASVPGFAHCRTYSPYSTAGYLPAAPDVITPQLLQLLADGEAVTPVSSPDGSEPLYVLLRKSLLEPGWGQTGDITMVDFCSELWGLATIWLGKEFFRDNGAVWPVAK